LILIYIICTFEDLVATQEEAGTELHAFYLVLDLRLELLLVLLKLGVDLVFERDLVLNDVVLELVVANLQQLNVFPSN